MVPEQDYKEIQILHLSTNVHMTWQQVWWQNECADDKTMVLLTYLKVVMETYRWLILQQPQKKQQRSE